LRPATERLNSGWRAQEVDEVVSHVDTETRHTTGWALLGLAAPATTRIESLGVGEIRLCVVNHSELTIVDHLLQPTIRRLTTSVVAHLEHDAGIGCGLGRPLGLGDGERERLVAKHMFACRRCLDNEIGVRRVWCRDEHTLDIGIGQDLLV
jgi:hypothetical protein